MDNVREHSSWFSHCIVCFFLQFTISATVLPGSSVLSLARSGVCLLLLVAYWHSFMSGRRVIGPKGRGEAERICSISMTAQSTCKWVRRRTTCTHTLSLHSKVCTKVSWAKYHRWVLNYKMWGCAAYIIAPQDNKLSRSVITHSVMFADAAKKKRKRKNTFGLVPRSPL